MTTEGDKPKDDRWPIVACLAAFVLVCLGPTVLFLVVGLSADETADNRVSASTLAWLIGIEAVVGGVLAALLWAITRSSTGKARSIVTAFLLAGAGAWGLLTGFLGAVAISYERHPGWDDA